MKYTNLNLNTVYSFLDSSIRLDDLIVFAKENQIDTLSVTDINNMYSTYDLFKKTKKENIKLLIGIETNINDSKVLFIAKNDLGLKWLFNLTKVLSLKLIKESELLKSENVFCILTQTDSIDLFKSKFGPENIFVGSSSREEDTDIKYVPLSKVSYLSKDMQKATHALRCIKIGQVFNNNIDLKNESYIHQSEAKDIYSKDQLKNLDFIINNCDVRFKFEQDNFLKYPTPNNISSNVYLNALVKDGLRNHFNSSKVEIEYVERAKYELEIINRMGFEDYFLIVHDYVKFAKDNNIYVGDGRGSAAGSLVSYLLGITNLDPIKNKLFFERFLNPERTSMPDIDVDFEDNRRQEIIDYILRKYGKDNFAHIVTFQTIQVKMAIRDIGRILEISLDDINKISKAFSTEMVKSMDEAISKSNVLKIMADKYPMLFELSGKILDIPRQIGMHAAGIVLSKNSIFDRIPVTDSGNGYYITQYSMDFLEELGLIKMDILGLRNLSIMHSIVDEIKSNRNKTIDLDKISWNDKKTFALLTNGDTNGIFQLESEGMKKVLTSLKVDSIEDIVATSSLFRPGPQANIPSFIKRKHGVEKIEYIDSELEDVLRNTYGIIVYQEQIMEVAKIFAGFSLGKADLLRRAMGKKDIKYMKQLEQEFYNGAQELGHSLKQAKEVYELIYKFADYGFNRSHALAYSVIGYKMAYLKANYSLEFISSLISSVLSSDTKIFEYLTEARKYGVEILPPSISKSGANFEIENVSIRYSLLAIKDLGQIAYNKIVEEREKKPFENIFDVINRLKFAGVNEKILSNLIYSGAFDDFGINRTTIEKNLEEIINYGNLIKVKKGDEVYFDFTLYNPPKLNEFKDDDVDIANKEFDVLGLYLKNHPLKKLKDGLDKNSYTDLISLEASKNTQFKVIGIVNSIKAFRTKTGVNMAFVKISDDTWSIDFGVFGYMYDKYKDMWIKGNVYNFEIKKTIKKDGNTSYALQSAKEFTKL